MHYADFLLRSCKFILNFIYLRPNRVLKNTKTLFISLQRNDQYHLGMWAASETIRILSSKQMHLDFIKNLVVNLFCIDLRKSIKYWKKNSRFLVQMKRLESINQSQTFWRQYFISSNCHKFQHGRFHHAPSNEWMKVINFSSQ